MDIADALASIPGMTVTYEAWSDPHAMADIDAWVKGEGRTLMFVYGEEDPWTAGAFELGQAVDSYRYMVTGGTHMSLIQDLPADQRMEARDTLSRWLGVSLPSASADVHLLEAFRKNAVRPRASAPGVSSMAPLQPPTGSPACSR